MIKKRLSKYYLFIAVATLISITFVIIQSSYNNLIGPIKAAKAGNLTKPLTTDLNIEMIEKLETQIEYQPDQIVNDIWYRANQPSPSPTPSLTIPSITPTPAVSL